MRRLLLLGVAVVATGALLVGTVGANNTGSVDIGAVNTSPLSVNGLVNAQLAGQPGAITANGVAQVVGDIQVFQPGGPPDANAPGGNVYHLRTTNATTTQGTPSGACGSWGPTYDTTFGQIPLTNFWQSTGTLRLVMHPEASLSCVASGAVVTITYEAF